MANATELKIVLIPGPSPGDDKDAGLDNFDAIGDALQSLGHEAVRVESIFTLVEALAEGKHHEWDLVLNLAEGLRGSAKVAQVTSLCEAYDKNLAKAVLKEAGIPVTNSTLLKDTDEFDGRDTAGWLSRIECVGAFDLFIKLNAAGTSRGVSAKCRARSVEAANEAVQDLRAAFPGHDILIEQFIDGREFSVSMLGTGVDAEVVGVMEMIWSQGAPPFRTRQEKLKGREGRAWMGRVVDSGSDEEVLIAEETAKEAWSAIGCRDGGCVDVRLKGSRSDAQTCVLEINALPDLRPNSADLPLTAKQKGMEYEQLIEKLIESARRRIA